MKIFIAIALLFWMASHKVMSMTIPTPPDGFTMPQNTTGFDFAITMTDMPEENIDKALFPEVGNYSIQAFEYVNHQNEPFDKYAKTYQCYDHYIKCLTTLSVPTTVCAFYSYKKTVYLTRNNYCEVHLENCRLGERYWKILVFGDCNDIEDRVTVYKQMMVFFDATKIALQTAMKAASDWAQSAADWIIAQKFFWQG